MKIILAQTNPTPRDFTGNTKQIIDGIELARKNEADLIVFPELAIPGYLSRDLVYDRNFVETNLHKLQEIINITSGCKKLTAVLGYIDFNHTGVGKPFRNAAAVIRDGYLVATYYKHLLPFYDVFDEGRYFEPGKELTVVEICGEKWGIIICEDGWNCKGSDDYNYRCIPVESYRNIDIKNFISINSSPYTQGKPFNRMTILKRASEPGGKLIYVNQIGGQDELVFDGHSFVCVNGDIKYVANGPKTQDSGTPTEPSYNGFNFNTDAIHTHNSTHELYEVLISGLRDYVRKSGFKEVVVGSSGGIDSAVVLALACESLGPKNVHAIRMPGPYSSKGSIDDAIQLHKNLGCHDYVRPISDEFKSFISHKNDLTTLGHNYNPVADENIQARLRGMTIMQFSNAYGALALTTGNKSELAVGYCTVHGDMAGGFAPISDLYKTEVYALAKYMNDQYCEPFIPENIINKAPSAELAPDQFDEKSLLPYPVLDCVLRYYIEDYVTTFDKFYPLWEKYCRFESNYPIGTWTNTPEFCVQYNRIIRLIDRNEFKRRQAAPGIKVSRVAFGTGRRLPIVKGF